MTEAGKTGAAASNAAEPIIELVETIPARYLLLAVAVGFVIAFAVLYVTSDRLKSMTEGTDDGE